ncbi:PaaI family thioesterase [Hyphomicrobiales bacterium]|nr:PaaI family thioesterase [Hyphomicrobiales bacterium]CAH1695308.1 PaaI family thioesterase [Hyphomicrobiales bacterium]
MTVDLSKTAGGSKGSAKPLSPAEVSGWLARSPFIAFLGLELHEMDPAAGTLTLRMALKPEFERSAGSTGRWHGGVVSAMIDTAGDVALIMLHGAAPPTINVRVDYLRPIVGEALTARATIRKSGRSIAFVDIDVFGPDGALVAIGRANYAMNGLPRPATEMAT